MKVARLKTIRRIFNNSSEVMDVFDGNLDDNSVSTVNIIDQSITAEKIQDESIDFNKITPDTKYISTNNNGASFMNIGGIYKGFNIGNKSIKDIIKQMLTPDNTLPDVRVLYDINGVTHENIYSNSMDYIPVSDPITFNNLKLYITPRSDILDSVTVTVNFDNYNPITDTFDLLPSGDKQNTAILVECPTLTKVISAGLGYSMYITIEFKTNTGKILQAYNYYITTKPDIYYGNSSQAISTDNEAITNNISSLFNQEVFVSDIEYNSYGEATMTFSPNNKEYSYILIPGDMSYLKYAINDNGDIQSLEYVGQTSYTVKNIEIPYKMYRTCTCTTSRDHTYKFIIGGAGE